MRPIRTGEPTPETERWGVPEIMDYSKCDEMKTMEILDAICKQHNANGYNGVPKQWVIDYLDERDRKQREREARYQSDLANAESIAVLKEQAETLKQQVRELRQYSASTSRQAATANWIALVAVIVAAISLLLQLIGYAS